MNLSRPTIEARIAEREALLLTRLPGQVLHGVRVWLGRYRAALGRMG